MSTVRKVVRDLEVGDSWMDSDYTAFVLLTKPVLDPESPQGRWVFDVRNLDTERVEHHQSQPHFTIDVDQ